MDRTRRIEQRTDPALERTLKGLCRKLLRDAFILSTSAALHELIHTTLRLTRTARAWIYKEQLREIPDRRQFNIMRPALMHRCGCVMRSKVEPTEGAAALVCRYLESIVAGCRRGKRTAFSKHSTVCSKLPSVAPAVTRASGRDLPGRRQARPCRHRFSRGNPFNF